VVKNNWEVDNLRKKAKGSSFDKLRISKGLERLGFDKKGLPRLNF